MRAILNSILLSRVRLMQLRCFDFSGARRAPARLAIVMLCAAFAACGGGDGGSPGTPPTAPDPTPIPPSGTVRISVPPAILGAISVSVQLQPSQGGAPVAVGANEQRALPAGTYTLLAPLITDARGHRWRSPQHGQSVVVGPGTLADLSVTYAQGTGSLVSALDGLPTDRLPLAGSPGRISLEVVALDSLTNAPRLWFPGDSLHGLWPGSYRVRTVPLVDRDGNAWLPADTTAMFSITAASTTATVAASYALAPSALSFAADGLPNDAPSLIDATRAGVAFVAELGSAYADWPLGASTATLRPLVRNGARWSAPSLSFAHRAGLDTTLRFAVAVSAGRVRVVASGLPASLQDSARWTLTPAQASFAAVIGRAAAEMNGPQLDLVAVGAYTLRATPVVQGTVRWRAVGLGNTESGLTLEVRDSLHTVPVVYSAQSGALQADISGVPSGATASVRVEAVGSGAIVAPGLVATLTGTQTVPNLVPGSYRAIAAVLLDAQGQRYRTASDTTLFTIASGDTTTVALEYTLTPAIVRVVVSGLPDGLNTAPSLTLQASGQSAVSVAAGAPISNVPAGSLTARMAPLTEAGARWQAPTVTINYVQGTDTTITLNATLSAGRLLIVPAGLPASGQGSLGWTLATSGQAPQTGTGLQLDAVPVGSFTLQLNEVLAEADRWRPTTTSAMAGTMSAALQQWNTTYSRVTGHLQLNVTGLPDGNAASLRVARPGLPVLTVTHDTLVRGIAAGNTSITADTITVGGVKYAGTPRTSTVSFAGLNETRTVLVTYSNVQAPPPPPPPADGLVTDQVIITQAVQSTAGSVQLVADRPALLRVVVRAAAAGASNATVRVRLFHGASQIKDTVLTRSGSVPTTRNDAVLSNTWNWQLPASLVQPGLTVIAEADPEEVLTDNDRTDNIWPRSGGSGVVPTVRAMPTWRPVLVPLHFTVPDRTGNVTVGNAEGTYLDLVRRTMPVSTVEPSVRAPFAIDDTLPGSSDFNGWSSVLSKLNTLRLSESTSSQQFYYGVLPIGYSSGIAGLGFVPGRAAIGWDKAGSAGFVAAHEWGHNFSLWHAPCGNPGSEDASFPHAGGTIGGIGWDVDNNTLRPSTNFDLMGYCSAEVSWISDYHWNKALNYRASTALVMGATQALIITGRLDGAQITLDPAFVAPASSSSPALVGRAALRATHSLRLLDDAGTVLLERAIMPEGLDHTDVLLIGESVPVPTALLERVARIDVRDRRNPLARGELRRSSLRSEVVQGRVAPARVRSPVAASVAGGAAGDLELDTSLVRRVIVREAGSARVVGLFDRGRVPAAYTGAAYELLVSDGVRSWPVVR